MNPQLNYVRFYEGGIQALKLSTGFQSLAKYGAVYMHHIRESVGDPANKWSYLL
jgi:hypothetical protein